MRGRSAVRLVALCALVAGCSGATKTPFARAADTIAGELSAAALTIDDHRSGSVTREYAAATLGVIASQLDGAPDELRSAEGAPDSDAAERSASGVEGALAAVRSPCLDDGCDATGQVLRLRAVAESLTRLADG
ncbi:MAG TPA: hypothetical protein VGK63_04870 [Candidatus Limnocylindrales bacterium]